MAEKSALEGRYIEQLTAHLGDVDQREREEVINDIESHFAEARAGGALDETTIEKLGSPRQLARAYRIELAMPDSRRRGKMPDLETLFKLGGMVILASIPSLVIVVTLGALGIAFLIAGIAVIAGGLALLAGFDPNWVKWPYSTSEAFLVGSLMVVAGALSASLLARYVRFAARVVMKLIPRGH